MCSAPGLILLGSSACDVTEWTSSHLVFAFLSKLCVQPSRIVMFRCLPNLGCNEARVRFVIVEEQRVQHHVQ